jgi:hypothetical protein
LPRSPTPMRLRAQFLAPEIDRRPTETGRHLVSSLCKSAVWACRIKSGPTVQPSRSTKFVNLVKDFYAHACITLSIIASPPVMTRRLSGSMGPWRRKVLIRSGGCPVEQGSQWWPPVAPTASRASSSPGKNLVSRHQGPLSAPLIVSPRADVVSARRGRVQPPDAAERCQNQGGGSAWRECIGFEQSFRKRGDLTER